VLVTVNAIQQYVNLNDVFYFHTLKREFGRAINCAALVLITKYSENLRDHDSNMDAQQCVFDFRQINGK